MELADFNPDEVVQWIERLETDSSLMMKTLERALDDVPIIQYWVHTHLAGQKNDIPEDLLHRIKDLVNLLLSLYIIERQQKN